MSAVWALAFSLLCLIFMNPILYALGASENTIDYARQYMFFVVVIGAVPTVLSNTMSSMLRNVGYSKEAAFGLGFGGVLNVICIFIIDKVQGVSCGYPLISLFYIFNNNLTSVINSFIPRASNIFQHLMFFIGITHCGSFSVTACCKSPKSIIQKFFRISQ